MKAICTRTIFASALCLLIACNSRGKTETNTADTPVTAKEQTFKSKQYTNFASSHIIALQDSLLFLYNVEEDEMIPFHLEEPDEIFNFQFDPDGRTMYYTVVREGTLWLRKATFTEGGGRLEDLINLNIPKEKCMAEIFNDRSSLEYRNGKLLLRSNCTYEAFGFDTYNIYSIADNSLTTTQDLDRLRELFGAPLEGLEKSFDVDNEQLFYRHNNQRACLTDRLNLKKDEYDEPIDYAKAMICPDGTKVAFVAINSPGDVAQGPLCIADADGTNQQILSENVIITDSFAPKWMGNKLLYIDTDNDADVEKDSDCPTSLYSTDPDNGNTKERIFAGIRAFDIKLPANDTKKAK